MVWKFEIIKLFDHHNRGHFIFARQLQFTQTIAVPESALLNGISVYHYMEMYPLKDRDGKPKLDIYVFRPESVWFPENYFKEGQIVELVTPD